MRSLNVPAILPGYLVAIILWLPDQGVCNNINDSSQSHGRPNIIIILADDLGYGDPGGYFGGSARTPNLDQLAREGMLFTDFHTNGTSCSPTRASLLTGRYPQRLGVEAAQRHVLDMKENQNELTLADYLRVIGYVTGIVGKWHLGRPPDGNPINYGFDSFVGYFGGDLDYFSKIDRYGNRDWWHNETLVTEDGYVTDIITRYSLEFIREHRSHPFFLYISHLAIHFPWQSPTSNELWWRKEGQQYTTVDAGFNSKLGPHDPTEIPAILTGMIEQLDQSVGSVVRELKVLKLDKNTLLLFLSDNGGYLNYSDGTWPMVGSNGMLHGQKGEVFEGGHRVPAIAWWPEHIAAYSVSDQTIMTMDILPTLLELTGDRFALKEPKASIDGISMLPLLLTGEPVENRTLFWRNGSNERAARQGFWKLIVQNDSVHLYDLSRDISETENMYEEHTDVARHLFQSLLEWETEMEDTWQSKKELSK